MFIISYIWAIQVPHIIYQLNANCMGGIAFTTSLYEFGIITWLLKDSKGTTFSSLSTVDLSTTRYYDKPKGE